MLLPIHPEAYVELDQPCARLLARPVALIRPSALTLGLFAPMSVVLFVAAWSYRYVRLSNTYQEEMPDAPWMVSGVRQAGRGWLV